MFETAMARPVAGHVPLPHQKNRPARLAIRFAMVGLRPPKDKAVLPALQVQIVLAQEVDAPQGAEPINWRLLSTVAVGSLEQVRQVVVWRIHYMTLLGREVPDMPCDVLFGEALAHSTKNPIAPEQAPPLRKPSTCWARSAASWAASAIANRVPRHCGGG